MASKTSKLTAKAAIIKVLTDANKPVRVPEIIAAAVPLTNLGGKTPGQTIYSVLYSEAKKGTFKRTGKGTFKMGTVKTVAVKAPAAKAASKPAAKADPKPSARKRTPRKPVAAAA